MKFHSLFFLSILTSGVLLFADMPVAELNFDDIPTEPGNLLEWSLSNKSEENGDILPEEVSIVKIDTPSHIGALRIHFQSERSIILTQTQKTAELQPSTTYKLHVIARSPVDWVGSCFVLVTDARWQWQSPRLSITESSEWKTYSLSFLTPPIMDSASSRIRIEAKGIGEIEIAEVLLHEMDVSQGDAQKSGTISNASIDKKKGNTEVTLDTMKDANLIENGNFQRMSDSNSTGWSYHPADTSLIKILPASDGVASQTVEMDMGVGTLSLVGKVIPVQPNTAYTLALELKQEDIHVGFGMGAQIQIQWAAKANSGWQPQVLEKIDGSFDWKTLTYSAISPPDARVARIILTKNGAPGRIFFRDIRLAQGALKRTEQDLQAKELFAETLALDFLNNRMAHFMADKGHLSIPGVLEWQKRISEEVQKEKAVVEAVLQTRQPPLSHDEKFEVRWADMLMGSTGFKVRPDSPHYVAWKKLSDQVAKLKESVNTWLRAHNQKRLQSEMTKVFGNFFGYAVGVDSPMTKVLRDRPYMGNPSRSTEIALARNEEESVQVTLSALDTDLENITVAVGSFKDAAGQKLSPDQLSVSRIDFVKTSPPQYDVEEVGWWPDIVYPEQTTKHIAKGTNQSFWVTVVTDSKTEPGVYQGDIFIKQGDKVLQKIALKIHVWDLEIPRPGKFKVVGRFSPEQLSSFYKWKQPKEDVLAKWNRYIFEKRWNSTDPFATTLTPRGASLKAANEAGLNSIILLNASQLMERNRENRTYTWPDAATEKKITESVKKALQEFKDTTGNTEATLYVFGFDEQHDPSQYPLMRHVFELVKKVAPGIRIMTTTTYSPLKELVGSVDTWVPLLGSDNEELKERQKAGDELFFYIYAHPFHPYPNAAQVDYPGIDGRISFWLAARQGYTGFLHWLMNGWFANSDTDGRWPQIDWHPRSGHNFIRRNGEGYFLYPGPNENPISSIRFELIRDGIEDWELINLLRETVDKVEKEDPTSPALTQAKEALSEGLSLVPALDSYSVDVQRLMNVRTKIAEALLALRKEKATGSLATSQTH